LQFVKSAAPLELVSPLAEWSVRALQYDVFKALRPRTIRNVHDAASRARSSTFERELAWSVAILNANGDLLKRFVRLKDNLESSLLTADDDHCLATLASIDREIGPSLWSISTKIALLQIFKGIEAQKHYSSLLRKSDARHFVRFLIFWWSERAEEDTTPERFLARIAKQLDVWPISPETRAYIDYHIRTSFPAPGSEELLLAASMSTSVVDFFQLFCALAVVVVAEERERANYFARAAADLIGIIGDPILEKVALLGGCLNKLEISRTTDLTFQNAAITGDRPSSRINPPSLEAYAAAGHLGLSFATDNALTTRVSTALKEIELPGTAGIRSAAELFKLGLITDKLNFGKWCLAKSLEQRADGLFPTSSLERLRFLSTSLIEPFALRYVPRPGNNDYFRQLKVVYGQAPCVKAAEIESSLLAINQANETDVGLNYRDDFIIRKALSENDYVTALERAEAIHKRLTRPTKLSIRTEVISLIVLDQLEESIRRAVNWCLTDTRLAMWVPLESLHEAIQSTSKATDHLIEKSILYDLLSKYRNTTYNSFRAYACEDYLLHLGVERPSQLDIGQPPASKKLFIYFLLHRAVVWVIISQFRSTVFCCC
jgi:hypothetical protein